MSFAHLVSALFHFFFSADRPIALIINVVITVFGGLAIRQLISARKRVKEQEQRALERLRAASGPDTTVDQVIATAAKLHEHSLARRRIFELRDCREGGQPIDQHVLATLAASELDRNIAFARWVAPSLVLLGLAGTLGGLSLAVGAANTLLESAQAGTLAGLKDAVTSTFGGITVAFSTTLWGVIWTFAVGLTLSVARREQSAFLEELERFTALHLLNLFQTSPGLALAQAAQKLTAIERQLDSSLREVIDQLHTRGQALTVTVEDRFQGLTRELATASAELLRRFEATHVAVDRLLGTPEAEAPSLHQTLGHLREGVTAFGAAVGDLQRLAPALGESIARQVDRQTADLHQTLHEYTTGFAQAAAQQEQSLAAFAEESRKTIPATGEAIARQIDRQTADIHEALHAYTGEMRDLVSRQEGQIAAVSRSTRELAAAVGALQAAEESMRAVVEQHLGAVAAAQAELVETAELLPARVAEGVVAVQATDGKVEALLTQVVDGIGRLDSRLEARGVPSGDGGGELKEAAHHLRESASQLARLAAASPPSSAASATLDGDRRVGILDRLLGRRP